MARPQLSAEEKKSAAVTVRMTQDEFAKLHYVATRLEVSPQDFIRYAVSTVYAAFIEGEREEKKRA